MFLFFKLMLTSFDWVGLLLYLQGQNSSLSQYLQTFISTFWFLHIAFKHGLHYTYTSPSPNSSTVPMWSICIVAWITGRYVRLMSQSSSSTPAFLFVFFLVFPFLLLLLTFFSAFTRLSPHLPHTFLLGWDFSYALNDLLSFVQLCSGLEKIQWKGGNTRISNLYSSSAQSDGLFHSKDLLLQCHQPLPPTNML